MSKQSELITNVTAKLPPSSPHRDFVGALKVAGLLVEPRLDKPRAKDKKRMPSSSRRRGEPNKFEARCLQQFKRCEADCWILDYKFEAVQLLLADNLTYRPDVLVLRDSVTEMGVEVHFFELKGYWPWPDDSRVKVKMAAEQYRHWYFHGLTQMQKKLGGGWRFENFVPAGTPHVRRQYKPIKAVEPPIEQILQLMYPSP